jgi:hypothetical protein
MTAKTMRREMLVMRRAGSLERTPMGRAAFPAPISTLERSATSSESVASQSGPNFGTLATLSVRLAVCSQRLTDLLQPLRSAASASKFAT